MQVIFWTARDADDYHEVCLPVSDSIGSKLETLRLSFFMFVMSFVWIFGFAAVGGPTSMDFIDSLVCYRVDMGSRMDMRRALASYREGQAIA